MAQACLFLRVKTFLGAVVGLAVGYICTQCASSDWGFCTCVQVQEAAEVIHFSLGSEIKRLGAER